MMQLGLIGIGAGAAAALLFASVTSGSWLSILLFYLAPLPIMIAGLGWSHWAAMAAALAGAIAVGAVFGSVMFLTFIASAGLPAWWLSYLALLARPASAGGNGAPQLEWYPPGRLVAWTAVLAALVVVVAIPNFGLTEEAFRAAVLRAVRRMLAVEDASRDGNVEGLITVLAFALPPAAAVLATITNNVNLWLAGRVVNYSGLLKRPWPDLAAMSFPRATLAALAVTMAVSFAGGLIGVVAGLVSASLMMAFGILGFAVLHAVTRGVASRPFLLGGVYASVAVFGWPILALCLIGVAETAFDLRARVARKRGRTGDPPPLI